MDEIKSQLQQLAERFGKISEQFDLDKLRSEINELETEVNGEGFWNDPTTAQVISRQLSEKQKLLSSLEGLGGRIENSLELAGEAEMQTELTKESGLIAELLDDLELKLFLSAEHDDSEAILSIHAGAGGVEAMDWASMLSRMYQRYFEKTGWEYELSDITPGDEAGLKSTTLIVHADFAYGLLKGEYGTHRLVRQSPFNADKLRQTSFALVEILPVIEDQAESQIPDSELEFSAFRSGGAGGQNVNKVNTAVRLKHIPSGIVVTAQTERSQLQNRENALKLLRAKLWALKLTQDKSDQQAIKGDKTQASFGSQIRSYVLHPYKMVKDLRTGVETNQAEAVLDGDLQQFIEAEVRTLDKN